MRAILKFGGSILAPDGIDTELLNELVSKIHSWRKDNELALVIGAGKLSREYCEMGRDFTSDEMLLHRIGIMVARLNASVVIAVLGDAACPEIPRDEQEFLQLADRYPGKIIVSGGFQPGQRTDAVAVEIAQAWGAELIIKATNVDYAYDKNPSENQDAKPLESISFEELKTLGDDASMAGAPTIMDGVAAKLLTESKIKVAIVNGRNFPEIEKALYGKDFKGTRVGF